MLTGGQTKQVTGNVMVKYCGAFWGTYDVLPVSLRRSKNLVVGGIGRAHKIFRKRTKRTYPWSSERKIRRCLWGFFFGFFFFFRMKKKKQMMET